MSDTRIVLVKPGDVLMIGNLSFPDEDQAREQFDSLFKMLKETVGLAHVFVFEDDIDLAVKPGTETVVHHVEADSGAQIRHGLDYMRRQYDMGGHIGRKA